MALISSVKCERIEAAWDCIATAGLAAFSRRFLPANTYGRIPRDSALTFYFRALPTRPVTFLMAQGFA